MRSCECGRVDENTLGDPGRRRRRRRSRQETNWSCNVENDPRNESNTTEAVPPQAGATATLRREAVACVTRAGLGSECDRTGVPSSIARARSSQRARRPGRRSMPFSRSSARRPSECPPRRLRIGSERCSGPVFCSRRPSVVRAGVGPGARAGRDASRENVRVGPENGFQGLGLLTDLVRPREDPDGVLGGTRRRGSRRVPRFRDAAGKEFRTVVPHRRSHAGGPRRIRQGELERGVRTRRFEGGSRCLSPRILA